MFKTVQFISTPNWKMESKPQSNNKKNMCYFACFLCFPEALTKRYSTSRWLALSTISPASPKAEISNLPCDRAITQQLCLLSGGRWVMGFFVLLELFYFVLSVLLIKEKGMGKYTKCQRDLVVVGVLKLSTTGASKVNIKRMWTFTLFFYLHRAASGWKNHVLFKLNG